MNVHSRPFPVSRQSPHSAVFQTRTLTFHQLYCLQKDITVSFMGAILTLNCFPFKPVSSTCCWIRIRQSKGLSRLVLNSSSARMRGKWSLSDPEDKLDFFPKYNCCLPGTLYIRSTSALCLHCWSTNLYLIPRPPKSLTRTPLFSTPPPSVYSARRRKSSLSVSRSWILTAKLP